MITIPESSYNCLLAHDDAVSEAIGALDLTHIGGELHQHTGSHSGLHGTLDEQVGVHTHMQLALFQYVFCSYWHLQREKLSWVNENLYENLTGSTFVHQQIGGEMHSIGVNPPLVEHSQLSNTKQNKSISTIYTQHPMHNTNQYITIKKNNKTVVVMCRSLQGLRLAASPAHPPAPLDPSGEQSLWTGRQGEPPT